MLAITINGQKVAAEKGSTVLQACRNLGIDIPALCHHDMVEPYGVCRLCTVEVKAGRRTRLVTACNYPVKEDIEVFTDSPEVLEVRKLLIELLMARSGKVPLIQQLAEKYGITEPRFGSGADGCILCGLCVRVCADVIHANALGFKSRGIERQLTLPFEIDTNACIACGACAEVCPTDYITAHDIQQGIGAIIKNKQLPTK